MSRPGLERASGSGVPDLERGKSRPGLERGASGHLRPALDRTASGQTPFKRGVSKSKSISFDEDYANPTKNPLLEESTVQKSKGLSSQQAAVLLEKHGKNELPQKVVPLWYIFVSLLWQP